MSKHPTDTDAKAVQAANRLRNKAIAAPKPNKTQQVSKHPTETDAKAVQAANRLRNKKVLPNRPNPETRPNVKTCKQFAETGVCSFGGKCKFQHTLADALRNAIAI